MPELKTENQNPLISPFAKGEAKQGDFVKTGLSQNYGMISAAVAEATQQMNQGSCALCQPDVRKYTFFVDKFYQRKYYFACEWKDCNGGGTSYPRQIMQSRNRSQQNFL